MVMGYESADSSGTDDDLPPLHNHFSRGGNISSVGRLANVSRGSFLRVQNEMETQLHHIEKEAYCSVLRAFKAQSDAITWEQESLITDLRKELRVSDDEHRELLSMVNGDDMIGRIREWRRESGLQAGTHSGAQHPDTDVLAIQSISGSRKRHKSSLLVEPLPPGSPSFALLPSTQSSLPSIKHGSISANGGTKHKPFSTTSRGERTQAVHCGSYGAVASNEHAERPTTNPYIGKKVWTRWPEDDHFYEATITDYDALQGKHVLVYTADSTWECVTLDEISPEDIRWVGEEPGASRKGIHSGSGRGYKRSVDRGGLVSGSGRGRGVRNVLTKSDFSQQQNGIGKKSPGCIELFHTETLINKVEKIFNASQPDLMEIHKAKRVLKEQEQALVDAIAMLEDISDGENGNK